jgi:hypothetical protein
MKGKLKQKPAYGTLSWWCRLPVSTVEKIREFKKKYPTSTYSDIADVALNQYMDSNPEAIVKKIKKGR